MIIDDRPPSATVLVRLKRMYGVKETSFGKQVEDFEQCEILAGVDDKSLVRIGYVKTDAPDRPVNFIQPDLPDHVVEAVQQAVVQELGGQQRRTAAPPPSIDVDDAGDDDE